MLDPLTPQPEPQNAPPEVGLNMGRNLAQIVLALAALLLLVNLPVNLQGHGLAQLSPQATALTIYDGMLLRGSGPEVYRLEQHKLRRLSDPEAFKAAYFPQDNIHLVEDSLLTQFAQGQPIRRWLKCPSGPDIYALENGQKRLCPSGCASTANSAFRWDKPYRVSCETLRRLPDGPAITVEAASPPVAIPSYSFGRLPGLPNLLGYTLMATLLAALTALLPWLGGGIIVIAGLWLVWQHFRPQKAQSQDAVAQALLYQAQIERALKTTANPGDSAQQQLKIKIAAWIKAIQELARRISAWQQDDLIRREMAAVPAAIEALQTQLAGATDAALRRQLQRALTNRHNQLASLQGLQRTITQAEIQIENTLSLLGLIYSQILTGQSTRHMADYGRLSAEVDEEVQRLQDRLEALREVKGEYYALGQHIVRPLP